MTIDSNIASVEGNYSLVRSRVWLQSMPAYSFYGQSSLHVQSIAGVTVVNTYITRDIPLGGYILILDNSRYVSHNADGTQTAYSGANFQNGPTGFLALGTTLTLDTIPRATTPNWSGNFEGGAAKTINLPRASSGFTHDVSYVFGSQTGSIATGAGVTTSWTPSLALVNEIPNAASGTGTLTVVTKSDATIIGTKAVPFTLAAGSGIIPVVDTVLWDDANTTVKTNIGRFVQGLSLVKGTVTASGLYGSTITDKWLRLGTTLIPEDTPFQIAGSGTVTASGEAVDSRGRLGTKAANFTVLPYTPPTIGVNGWQVQRANASNVPTDTGAYLRVDLHAIVVSLISASTEKNALTITVRTRPVGGSWTTRNVITPGLTHNAAFLVTGGAVFLITTSYEVEITLEDKTGIEATRLVTTIPTATVTLDLNGTKVGVGKYWEQGALDVGGDIYMNGTKVSVVGHTHAGTDITSGTIAAARLPAATVATAGAVERATQDEVNEGADTTRYVSPATLRNRAYAPYAVAAGQASISATPYTTVTMPVGRFTQPPMVVVRVISSGSGQVLTSWSNGVVGAANFGIGTISLGGAWTAGVIQWQAIQMTSASGQG